MIEWFPVYYNWDERQRSSVLNWYYAIIQQEFRGNSHEMHKISLPLTWFGLDPINKWKTPFGFVLVVPCSAL